MVTVVFYLEKRCDPFLEGYSKGRCEYLKGRYNDVEKMLKFCSYYLEDFISKKLIKKYGITYTKVFYSNEKLQGSFYKNNHKNSGKF